ncbi:MAG: sulfotransferase [Pseudomonadota bacterium]|jgi:hypothetical protein|nr:sulfotransferase [Pseudomonadota bacterium]
MSTHKTQFLRRSLRALVGPRYTWRLSSQAGHLGDNLPVRLDDARARLSDAAQAEETQPIFVLSAGWRSGSTLLQRMIMENQKDLLLWGEPFPHCNIYDGLTNQFRAFTPEWPPSPYFLSAMKLQNPADTWVANLYPEVDDLLRAHRSFHNVLFAEPARRAGCVRWGLKEVRLTIDHATYLRFLFPKCKIVLLYRNPYDAYLSFSHWNVTVFRTWPHRFVTTPYAFGRHWAELTRGYLDGHKRIDALLIRYEDLDNPAVIDRLQTYLGWAVPRASQMRLIREPDYSRAARRPRRKSLLGAERALLTLATRGVRRDAGYGDEA